MINHLPMDDWNKGMKVAFGLILLSLILAIGIYLTNPKHISIFISSLSFFIASISLWVAFSSDKKVETIGRENTLKALGDLEDPRLELKEMLLSKNKVIGLRKNLWKTRTYLERILLLEQIIKYKQMRKIRYIHKYLAQFYCLLNKKESRIDEINDDVKKDMVDHIESIYRKVKDIDGFEKYNEDNLPDEEKIDTSMEDLKEDIINKFSS